MRKREVILGSSYATVALTKGYSCTIDLGDVGVVGQHNWHVVEGRSNRYARTKTEGKWVYMHRMLMGGCDEAPVDHRDGDGLNNRRNNLRVASPSHNAWNSQIRENNTSSFKGVTWSKHANKWTAQITVRYKKRHLGYFESASAAHEAYCEASKECHGEFSRTD